MNKNKKICENVRTLTYIWSILPYTHIINGQELNKQQLQRTKYVDCPSWSLCKPRIYMYQLFYTKSCEYSCQHWHRVQTTEACPPESLNHTVFRSAMTQGTNNRSMSTRKLKPYCAHVSNDTGYRQQKHMSTRKLKPYCESYYILITIQEKAQTVKT